MERRTAKCVRDKRVQELESLIHALQDEIAVIMQAMEAASLSGNVADVTRLSTDYNAREAELNHALEEWADLAE